jgi:hypothetical protein
MHSSYIELHNKVKVACNDVATILNKHRNPMPPTEVPHKYDDKFALGDHIVFIEFTIIAN